MACLPAWPNQTDSTTLCLYKSQPDSGGRRRLVNLWEPFRSQITLIWYWPWSHTCTGHTLCFTRTFPILGLPCLFRTFSSLSGPRLKIPQVTYSHPYTRSSDRLWLVPWQWTAQVAAGTILSGKAPFWGKSSCIGSGPVYLD